MWHNISHDSVLAATGLDKSDVDWLVAHQANCRLIAATARKPGMPMSKVVQTVADYGNTSAAAIPLALDVALRAGDIQAGQLILTEQFGVLHGALH